MIVNFGVNYFAVIVAAVVAMVIGFAWYSPQVFGNRWMAYLGTTQAQLGNPGAMGWPWVSWPLWPMHGCSRSSR